MFSPRRYQLVYWRRIDTDHVYVEYKDNDHQPELNSKDVDRQGNPREHGHRRISQVISINQFEIRHGMVHPGDDNGDNYRQPKNFTHK